MQLFVAEQIFDDFTGFVGARRWRRSMTCWVSLLPTSVCLTVLRSNSLSTMRRVETMSFSFSMASCREVNGWCETNCIPKVVQRRIAGQPCRILVGFREAAVDDDQFAVRLQRILADLFFNWRVTIDDMAFFRIQSEFLQYFVGQFHIVAVARNTGFSSQHEFLCRHNRDARKSSSCPCRTRKSFSFPQIPDQIQAYGCCVSLLRGSGNLCATLPRICPGGFAAVLDVCDRHLHEAPSGFSGTLTVEQQIVVVAQIHAAFTEKELNMLLQPFRVQETGHEPFDNQYFFFGQAVRISWIDRREIIAQRRIFFPINFTVPFS